MRTETTIILEGREEAHLLTQIGRWWTDESLIYTTNAKGERVMRPARRVIGRATAVGTHGRMASSMKQLRDLWSYCHDAIDYYCRASDDPDVPAFVRQIWLDEAIPEFEKVVDWLKDLIDQFGLTQEMARAGRGA